jgi:hypothetical protein
MDPTHCMRADGGKARLDLIPMRPLFALAAVIQSGIDKGYEENNWRKGGPWSRAGIGSALRHLFKFIAGEDVDPETKQPHLMHAAFWIFALYEWTHTHPELDDRWKGQLAP